MRITKTSAQAQAEKAQKKNFNQCPECKEPSFGVRRISYKGFFSSKSITTREHHCTNCGCEWEYDE